MTTDLDKAGEILERARQAAIVSPAITPSTAQTGKSRSKRDRSRRLNDGLVSVLAPSVSIIPGIASCSS